MDDQRCVWCGEPVEPACQGVVVIAEDERCYEGYDELSVDRTPRGLPRRYGHSACYLDSIPGYQLYRARQREESLRSEAG